jgi:hypothetical protein
MKVQTVINVLARKTSSPYEKRITLSFLGKFLRVTIGLGRALVRVKCGSDCLIKLRVSKAARLTAAATFRFCNIGVTTVSGRSIQVL